MEGKKREFEDLEIVDETSGKKGKVYRRNSPPKKNGSLRDRWRSLKKWKKTVIIAVLVLVLLLAIAFFTVWGVYNGFRTKIDESNLGVSDDIFAKYGDTDVFNVLVFGVDTRDKDAFSGRSDTIMIVSVNPKARTVKLTSILRDSYVAIEGHKNQKITHAYAFGGAELAINTVNRNFNMNITDYATINFYKMAEAIDILGGIDIEITKSEMEQINSEAIGGSQKGAALVHEYGLVHLDGDQATIFCRLRKQDSDEARSNRQKMVVNALLAQARKVSPTKYAEVVKSIMSLCETSLTFSEVMSFVPLLNENVTIEAITVPGEPENAFGGIYDGAWVWKYDLEQATNRIHMFIYGELPEKVETTTSKQKSSDKNSTSTTTRSNARNGDGTIVIVGETTTRGGSSQPVENTTQAAEITTLPEVQTEARTEEAQTSPPEPVTQQENTTAAQAEPTTSADEAA